MSIIIGLRGSLTEGASWLRRLRCEESPLGSPLCVKLGTGPLGLTSSIFSSPLPAVAFAILLWCLNWGQCRAILFRFGLLAAVLSWLLCDTSAGCLCPSTRDHLALQRATGLLFRYRKKWRSVLLQFSFEDCGRLCFYLAIFLPNPSGKSWFFLTIISFV